jgi:hypothetical protein
MVRGSNDTLEGEALGSNDTLEGEAFVSAVKRWSYPNAY